ncbi:MAG: ribonuclease HII, partial [Trichlorobacter sp.]
SYEQRFHRQGRQRIAGIDEAGRGPLAGPVVAAAVIFPAGFRPDQRITDSKKLTDRLREELFTIITQSALAYAIADTDAPTIDRINILQATRLAMRKAVEALPHPPDHLLIDGISTIESPLSQTTIIKGDSLSVSIAAASILAKVSRDRLMQDYHLLYPNYGFDRHKGYGSAAHMAALRQYGPCPIHRVSFRGVILDSD